MLRSGQRPGQLLPLGLRSRLRSPAHQRLRALLGHRVGDAQVFAAVHDVERAGSGGMSSGHAALTRFLAWRSGCHTNVHRNRITVIPLHRCEPAAALETACSTATTAAGCADGARPHTPWSRRPSETRALARPRLRAPRPGVPHRRRGSPRAERERPVESQRRRPDASNAALRNRARVERPGEDMKAQGRRT